MSDLFTSLVQGQTVSGKVQPRLLARFEEDAHKPAVEMEDIAQPIQEDDAQQSSTVLQPREASQTTSSHVSQTLNGYETIIETTEATKDNVFATADQALFTTNQPAVPSRQYQTTDQPSPATSGQSLIPTRRPLSPLESQESVPVFSEQPGGAVSPADAVGPEAPTIPAEGLDTIRPGKGEPDEAVETEQQIHPQEKPQSTGDLNQPQTVLMPTDAEFAAADPTAHPSAEPPTIEVHIGRIELRQAAPQIPNTSPARPRFEPPVSLSAYLERRNGGDE